MTYLKRCVWAAVIAAVAAGAATAQTTGTTTPTTTTGGTGGSTVTGLPGSSTPQNTNAVQAAEITSTTGGFSQSVVQPSNIIGPYFASPLFQGVPSSSATGATVTGPGGFGSPLFGGTGTAAGGTGGRATTAGARATNSGGTANRATGTTGGLQSGTTGTAGRTGGLQGGSTLGSPTAGLGGSTGGLQGGTTGAAGRTGGLGATGRAGGLGNTGLGGGANSTAQQLSTGRQVAYTQTLKFGVPPITTPQLQTDINALVSTSPTLSGVNGLQTTVADGGLVVVRGKVADEDEARLVEGVIMLTPGVKGVKNELEFPKPPSP